MLSFLICPDTVMLPGTLTEYVNSSGIHRKAEVGGPSNNDTKPAVANAPATIGNAQVANRKVQRAAFAAGVTVGLSQNFRHHAVRFSAARQQVPVITPCREDKILGPQHGAGSHGRRFLTDVQVVMA